MRQQAASGSGVCLEMGWTGEEGEEGEEGGGAGGRGGEEGGEGTGVGWGGVVLTRCCSDVSVPITA